ncbi:MAG: hypothetical protein AB7S26_31060 [Sandaracinaceae bacterium]
MIAASVALVPSALIPIAGCGTIDLGDHIVPPDLRLDEDFFYCEIQPNILTAKSCASGGSGEGGMCHDSRSALLLVDTMSAPPDCVDGVIVGGSVSADYMANFEAIRFTVQSDPLSSPLYRRPTGMDSHPRVIFPESDPCAQTIADWINRGAF